MVSPSSLLLSATKLYQISTPRLHENLHGLPFFAPSLRDEALPDFYTTSSRKSAWSPLLRSFSPRRSSTRFLHHVFTKICMVSPSSLLLSATKLYQISTPRLP